MNKYGLSLLLLIFTAQVNFAQHTEIQFPRLNYQMKMNQSLEPAASYFIQNDIIAGDKSGIVFTTAVEGKDVNLGSDITSMVDLNSLKFTIAPVSYFNFHAFYGRYKFLAEDLVVPSGFQHNYSPNADLYGIMPVSGSGLAISTPLSYGKYEPEVILFSSNFEGVDYLNLFIFATFRFNIIELQLYSGVSIPTTTSLNSEVKGSGGFMIYTVMDYVNVYFSTYISPYYGETFTFDDVYMRLSQHLLINMFEQTFSFTTLGSAGDNLGYNDVSPLIGANGIPDLNIYLSLGARIHNVGVGAEYGYIYGMHENTAILGGTIPLSSQRLGMYADIQYLGITYRAGAFYTFPDSTAYLHDNSKSGEAGFYVSVYGRV